VVTFEAEHSGKHLYQVFIVIHHQDLVDGGVIGRT
jgi:hypothetical protein